MTKKIEYGIAAGSFCILVILINCLLFGKLFPYSPIIVGFARHELSHSLLHQHSGMIITFRYPAWLLEGIAVYSADQLGTSWYPSKEQTYDYIRKGNFMPPQYFETDQEDQIHLDVKQPIMSMTVQDRRLQQGELGHA